VCGNFHFYLISRLIEVQHIVREHLLVFIARESYSLLLSKNVDSMLV